MFSIGALFVYGLFLRTRLIPFWLSLWGVIGATLYLAFPLASLFGLKLEFLQLPLGLQEMVMAVWLIVKGFDQGEWDSLHAGPTREEARGRSMPG